MKRLFLMMLTLMMSVTTWATDPYFEVVRGSFQSGHVTVKATFPDATSVTPSSSLVWVYLKYNGYQNWNAGDAVHTSKAGTDISFDGNTFTATYSFTCPEGASDYDFSLSPYNNDIQVDGVGQPSSLVINMKACAHENLTFHAETTSTEKVHGHEAYNECTTCGKRFRAGDTGLTTPLTIDDVEYPLVCDSPYFEVVSGSIASGNAKVKITFPQASTVTMSEDFKLYYILYGSGEYYYNDETVAYVGSSKATAKGVSVIVDFGGAEFTHPSNAEVSLYYIYLYPNTIKVDGVYNTGIAIHWPAGYVFDDPDEPGDEPEDPVDLTNYFWLQNLSGAASQFLIPNRNIEYSTTPTVANSWVKMDNTYVDIAADEKVYLRASEEGNTNLSGHPLMIESNYKVGGDITTLLNAKGNVTALPAPEDKGHGYAFGVFENFFINDTYLQDVSELVLPSTTLTKYCYAGMFRGCDKITTAPVLPATVLVSQCYENMFNGCSHLNYVEAYFPEWLKKDTGYSPYAATENWLQGVAPEGTFKTHDWINNDYRYYESTYPSGWDKEDVTSMNITISAVGYTTFYYDRSWVMPEGMEGYNAYEEYNEETSGYDFVFEKVYDAGDVVCYNTPLVLKAAPGTYTINFTDEYPTKYVANSNLYGSVTSVDVTTTNVVYYNFYWYALSLNAGGDPESVGFYWMKDDGAAFTSSPFKAWLSISKLHFNSSSSVKAFLFNTASDTDAIKSVPVGQNESKQLFDLGGRRVNSNNQKSGIYIMNGKKIIR